MTPLLDTSALLTHYLAEPGAERVQALLEDDAVVAGASFLSLYEFELLQMHVIAGRDRHFLHAGNNPERANAAQAPAPLGANLRFVYAKPIPKPWDNSCRRSWRASRMMRFRVGP